MLHEGYHIKNHSVGELDWVVPIGYTPLLTDFELSRIPHGEYSFHLLDGSNILGTEPSRGDFLSVTLKGVQQSVLVYVRDLTDISFCCVELGGSFSIVDGKMVCDSKKIYLGREPR